MCKHKIQLLHCCFYAFINGSGSFSYIKQHHRQIHDFLDSKCKSKLFTSINKLIPFRVGRIRSLRQFDIPDIPTLCYGRRSCCIRTNSSFMQNTLPFFICVIGSLGIILITPRRITPCAKRGNSKPFWRRSLLFDGLKINRNGFSIIQWGYFLVLLAKRLILQPTLCDIDGSGKLEIFIIATNSNNSFICQTIFRTENSQKPITNTFIGYSLCRGQL